MREIGCDHLTLPVELVADEAACGLDDGLRVGAAARESPATRTASRIPRACARGRLLRLGDVIARHVHGAALRLEERDHRPHLLRRELLGHDGHDRLVAGDDVRRRVIERLVQVLLAALVGLPFGAANADRARALLVGEEVRSARAEAVARGAAPDPVEHPLAGGDELLRRHVGAERECLRHLGLDLRDLVGDERIQRQGPEDNPDDLRVSDPHAGPLSPSRRTSTSPRARRARTRTPRATGRSARTG